MPGPGWWIRQWQGTKTMDIVHPHIEDYLGKLTSPPYDVFREMEKRAQKENFPIVGPLVGRLLATFAKAIGAKKVFEMGSGFGYSGLWFASALPDDGKVIMTDTSKNNARDAKAYFEKAKQDDKCEFLYGDAAAIIENFPDTFDIVFIDMDKARYPLAFHKALPKLRVGGLLMADNVLWFGKVLEKNPDEDTKGILEFTRLIATTPSLSTTIIPLRDGVSVSVKGS